MRLLTHRVADRLRAGVLIGDLVVDAKAAADAAEIDGRRSWCSAKAILELDAEARENLRDAAGDLARSGGAPVVHLMDVELAPPIPDPDKIVGVGLNYRDHAEEMALEAPEAPALFPKFRNALVGSGCPIVLPPNSREIDFEGEVAVVIGRRAKDVAVADAVAHIGGYMPFNDVSARDLQMRTSQWMAGKVQDTFAPCGPALVLADEVADPASLEITTRVNGIVVQSASTAQMIFSIAEIVSLLSELMTLEVGDVIATGTPAGVGYRREPQLFLKSGDTVAVEIGDLPMLSNPVVPARR